MPVVRICLVKDNPVRRENLTGTLQELANANDKSSEVEDLIDYCGSISEGRATVAGRLH